jgi:hypothetical protein
VRNRGIVFLVAAVITGAILALAMALGSWAFNHRKATLHAGRLQRLTDQHPTGAQVEAALQAEGGRMIGEARQADEVRALIARVAPRVAGQVEAQARRYHRMRVALVDGMAYVLFFDEKDQLQDFLLSKAEGR